MPGVRWATSPTFGDASCEKEQIVFSPDESRAATLLCTEEPSLIDVIDVASMVRLIDTIEFPGATGVAFYDGGLRVFVEATHLKQAWEFWLAIDSAPQWLIELAEAVRKSNSAEGARRPHRTRRCLYSG
jgi:hypothetical protein